MDRNWLITQSPTAQVRIFAEELLKDGLIHSRKEISRYIEQQRRNYNLPEYRIGHESGGIQQATVNCERLGRASYRLRVTSQNGSEEFAPISRGQAAVQVLDHTIMQLAALAREIDYISADSEEMQELEKLKSTVQSLHDIKRIWN